MKRLDSLSKLVFNLVTQHAVCESNWSGGPRLDMELVSVAVGCGGLSACT
jgi:hypothetical protein